MSTRIRSLVPLAAAAALAATTSCSVQPSTDDHARSASRTAAPTSTRTTPETSPESTAVTASVDAPRTDDLPEPAPSGTRLSPAPEGAPTPDAPADGSPTGASADAHPVVSWAGVEDGEVVVNAYVAVLERGGTCTLVLTRGTDAVAVTATAGPDAEVTWCAPLGIPLADLTSGAWEAQVRYESAGSAGSSATTTVSVP